MSITRDFKFSILRLIIKLFDKTCDCPIDQSSEHIKHMILCIMLFQLLMKLTSMHFDKKKYMHFFLSVV
jgi:hypothetical protein